MAKKEIVPPPMKKLILLKLKLISILPKAKELAKTALSVAIICGGLGYLTVKAPEIHGQFLRYKVGSNVYKIQGNLKGGGGTGFSVKAASGETYVVTNSHVCEGALTQSEDKTSLLVIREDGSSIRRRILENSDVTDLCLLEGLPGVEGLSISDEPGLGSIAAIVGHPRLRPLSISRGEIVGSMDVQIIAYFMKGNPIIDELMGDEMSDGKCDLPKNKIEEMDTMFGKIKLCTNVTLGAYISTIVIFPGNSGSPMVDFLGRVQGVAFASDGTNWALVVSNSDLKKFLSRY
jgi:hypothetical protein